MTFSVLQSDFVRKHNVTFHGIRGLTWLMVNSISVYSNLNLKYRQTAHLVNSCDQAYFYSACTWKYCGLAQLTFAMSALCLGIHEQQRMWITCDLEALGICDKHRTFHSKDKTDNVSTGVDLHDIKKIGIPCPSNLSISGRTALKTLNTEAKIRSNQELFWPRIKQSSRPD